MGNIKKNNITIIEPSPVVRQGLEKYLDESVEFRLQDMYPDLPSFNDRTGDAVPDVIVLNPSVVNPYEQFTARSLFADYPDAVLVALLYGYADAETVRSFDGMIDIYDDGETILRKLANIIKESETGRHSRAAADNADLSDREKEILVSVAKGMTNKEIADTHFISVHTVISHRKNITRKIGIKTVSGLTMYAIFNNLVSQDDLSL